MSRLASSASSDDYYDSQLTAARDEALDLGWDVIETLGGVVAVPHGTELVAAPTVGALMTKLRAHLPVTVADPGNANGNPTRVMEVSR